MTTLSKGGLTDLRKNTAFTFFAKLGYLHLIAGTLFLISTVCMFWQKSWIETDTIEHWVGTILFIAATWGSAFFFGWLIEEIEVKFFKSNQINWTDAWWTSFGFPLFLMFFFLAPQNWFTTAAWISLGLLAVMGVGYGVYRIKNSGK